MTDSDLDTVYTALSEGIANVGEEHTPLMLAILCLSLLVERGAAAEVLPLITRAQELCKV